MVTMRSSSGMKRRERVQHGGLAGTGSAGDQNGGLRLHAGRQKLAASPGVSVLYCSISSCVITCRPKRRMLTARPVERQRRNDGVDARSVLQAGVDDGLRFVDAAAHLGNDLFDDVQQVRVVFETHRRFRQLAAALDEYLVVAVDQDIRDATAP